MEITMGHRQDMTPAQRLKFDSDNYKKRLEANKGSNYEYWNNKHDELLKKGWELALITKTATRQWSKIFKEDATSSEQHAKRIVDQLRADGNFARIVCGYEKNMQRVKMYSVIFKSKK